MALPPSRTAAPHTVGRPYYVRCPRCEAGSDLVALESIRFEQGEREVSVRAGIVEDNERAMVSVPDPRLEMSFRCFAGHRFLRRVRATGAGRVAITAHLPEHEGAQE